ncbi:MAG: ATP-binding cassette domain-containing protein [Clostridia bacterium]|nr:ATP-binding cassette domain-containing protein [Clostridia bacterium]
MPELVNCISYAERVFEFLNLPEEKMCEISVAGKKADLKEVNAIEFKDIVFGYSDKENIFNGKSYSFESNKITAIVGQSGCGKSTLAKLLLGFYQLQDGDICIRTIP